MYHFWNLHSLISFQCPFFLLLITSFLFVFLLYLWMKSIISIFYMVWLAVVLTHCLLLSKTLLPIFIISIPNFKLFGILLVIIFLNFLVFDSMEIFFTNASSKSKTLNNHNSLWIYSCKPPINFMKILWSSKFSLTPLPYFEIQCHNLVLTNQNSTSNVDTWTMYPLRS